MWYYVFLLVPSVILFLFWLLRYELIRNTSALSVPDISVLIAVRNEVDLLPELFESLARINYPKDSIHFLFGNDCSCDGSKELLLEMTKKKKYYEIIDIVPTSLHKAKANVLMQLCEKASGDYLFFLDADVIPNPDIIRSFVSHMKEGMGGVTGVTLPENTGLFSSFQEIDWCFALTIFSDSSQRKLDSTAMGNNMFVSRKVYEELGGYKNLPESLVEDFTLYHAIRDMGYEFPVLFDKGLLSRTKAMGSLKGVLNQRKRWMTGLWKMNPIMLSILFLQGVFYPLILISCFLNPLFGIAVWIIKMIVQMVYLISSYKKIQVKIPYGSLVLYELYNCFFVLTLGIYCLLPFSVKWKNRIYKND